MGNRVSVNNGRQTLVTATSAGSAQLLYTSPNDTSVGGAGLYAEITVLATNTDSSDRILTLLWGGTTNPDDYIPVPCPPGEQRVAIDRMLLNGGKEVRVFADVTAKVCVYLEIGSNQ